jgi:hypothetical protein
MFRHCKGAVSLPNRTFGPYHRTCLCASAHFQSQRLISVTPVPPHLSNIWPLSWTCPCVTRAFKVSAYQRFASAPPPIEHLAPILGHAYALQHAFKVSASPAPPRLSNIWPLSSDPPMRCYVSFQYLPINLLPFSIIMISLENIERISSLFNFQFLILTRGNIIFQVLAGRFLP